MKLIRLAVTVLFILSVVFTLYLRFTVKKDKTMPQISSTVDVINLSVEDSDDVILSYIKAYDEKDGDISDKVVVESISPYSVTGEADVVLAVSDSDNNVTRTTVNARYTDYYQPRFYIEKALIVPYKSSFDISDYIGAVDCIDGDQIANSVIYVTDCDTGTVGEYSVDVRVTNSRFDSASVSVTVLVSAKSTVNPIELSKYLVYCKTGEKIDYLQYVNRHDKDSVSVDATSVNLSVAGTYSAVYYMDGKDATTLYIICEEG